MRWFDRSDPECVSMSESGYYRIAREKDPRTAETVFTGYHIPALWAFPELLGDAPDIAGAQRLCEQHHSRHPSPTNNPE